MSIAVMSAVWKDSEAQGTDRLVLLALADRADDEGVCWPSQAGLAAKCRMSDRTVRRSIASLIDRGELQSEARPGTSNLYRVTVPAHPGQRCPTPPDTPDNGVLPPRTTVSYPPRTLLSSNTSLDSSLIRARGRSPLTELPDPFTVTPEMVEWAKHECPSIDRVVHTKRFVNYWRGEGKKKKDWVRTWKNWLLAEEARVPQARRSRAPT